MTIKPLDEFEADLYGESTASSPFGLWHFLATSVLFFALGALSLIISQTIGTSAGFHAQLIPLAGIFLALGSALLSGWILGVLTVVGTRIADWIC